MCILFIRYSPFLMACYDPDTEEYQSVCRVMSGFSDAFYKEVRHLCYLCLKYGLECDTKSGNTGKIYAYIGKIV